MPKNKSEPTINDKPWNQIFEKYNILDEISKNGVFKISAKQIKEFREPRLMTKFDHCANLPQIFVKNKLAILPDTRGTYIIGKFEAYNKIKKEKSSPETIYSKDMEEYLATIQYENIYSESAALLTAYNTGMISKFLSDVFPSENNKCYFTVNGRMSTKEINFKIKIVESPTFYSFSVLNSQCEIDAGFETSSKFLIFEAKNYLVDDFLTRQLYYPYRLWKSNLEELKIQKDILPIFMYYSNNIFTFCLYKFEDCDEYSSIKLVQKKSYVISTGDSAITVAEIKNIREQIKLEPEKIPFPQADKFERVIDLLFLLFKGEMTKEDLQTRYEFNPRQVDYYINSLKYLGLAETKQVKNEENKTEIKVCLTLEAENILLKNQKDKYIAIVERILSRKVFNQALKLYLENGGYLSIEETVIIINEAKISLTGTTIARRAQSVRSWIEWVVNLTEIFS